MTSMGTLTPPSDRDRGRAVVLLTAFRAPVPLTMVLISLCMLGQRLKVWAWTTIQCW